MSADEIDIAGSQISVPKRSLNRASDGIACFVNLA
jgi:hypothetical protein